MHETDSITAALLDILNREMGLGVTSPDADLFESGILDSFTLVNLLLHIESRFNVTVPLEQLNLDSFRSVGAMTGFIAAYRANGVPARAACVPGCKATGSPVAE